MPRKTIKSAQRERTTTPSGEKRRSPTSTSHKGSRVEPSHIVEKGRAVREKKIRRGTVA